MYVSRCICICIYVHMYYIYCYIYCKVHTLLPLDKLLQSSICISCGISYFCVFINFHCFNYFLNVLLFWSMHLFMYSFHQCFTNSYFLFPSDHYFLFGIAVKVNFSFEMCRSVGALTRLNIPIVAVEKMKCFFNGVKKCD